MMPVTHIAGALALTGWCLGPDPLVLVAGVTWAVLPDLDEVQSPLGWRVCQLLPNPVFGRGPSTDPFIPVEYRDGNCWVGHRVAIRDCGGTLGGMGQPYPVGCPIRGVPLWWPWYHGPESRVRLASWRNAGLADYLNCTCCVSAILLVAWQEQWVASWSDILHRAIREGRR